MKNLLLDEKYNFISKEDKDFIIAFDDAIIKAGHQSNGINPYVCLGKYKIEYSKVGLKNILQTLINIGNTLKTHLSL